MSANKKTRPPLALPLDLYEPAAYLRSMSRTAYFSILTRDPRSTDENNCEQFSFPTVELHEAIDFIRETYPNRDIWISQAESFAKNRQKRCLKSISTLFSDLDTYTPEASLQISGSPSEQTETLLNFCTQKGIPLPSTVIFSGHGLQARWLLKQELPRQALNRWEHAQRLLFERLRPLGADPKALDPCRVLRLIGTIHQETQEVVRETYTTGTRYDFEKLYWGLIETDGFDYELEIDQSGSVFRIPTSKFPKKPEVEPQEPRKTKTNQVLKNNVTGLKRSHASELANTRFNDLVMLANLRYPDGKIPSGMRDIFVFLASVFLSQAHADKNRINYLLKEFAKQHVPLWKENERINAASAAFKRLEESIQGKTRTFQGKEVDPQYHFKNETLISEEWLGITKDEQQQLKTIISPTESSRRAALRSKAKRLAQGSQDRKTYLSEKARKREEAMKMRESGSTWEEIAILLEYKNAESARRSCKTTSTSESQTETTKKQPTSLPSYIYTNALSPLLKKERPPRAFDMQGGRSSASGPLPPAAAQQFFSEEAPAQFLKRA